MRSLAYRLAVVAFLSMFVSGCQQNTATQTKIAVTYTLDEDIAAVDTLLNEEPYLGDPTASVAGTVFGDSTHPSYVEAHLYEDADSTVDSILLESPSPGFSGTETLSISGVSFSGKEVTIEYTKVSPSVNTDDFRQFTTVLRVETTK